MKTTAFSVAVVLAAMTTSVWTSAANAESAKHASVAAPAAHAPAASSSILGTGHKPARHAATSSDARAPKSGANGGHGAGWTYAGTGGPAHWGDLKPEYQACKAGSMQSPVDFQDSLEAGLPDIQFSYGIAPLTILNNGHTVQVNLPQGNTITVGGSKYELLQFHFHTPSEHTITGRRYPLEMHLVHKDKDGKLAVVAVFMEPGEHNFAVAEIWGHLPKTSSTAHTVDSVAINPRDLLPRDRRYYRYMGSLTTPPCSEGVNWHVMSGTVQISQSQIKSISTIMGDNARPPQPFHNRLVMKGK